MWVWCRGSGKVIWGEEEPEDGGGEEDRACRPPPVRRAQGVGGAVVQPEEGEWCALRTFRGGNG